jgi:ribokinase
VIEAIVFGQIALDLVLTVEQVPGPFDSRPRRQRHEMLGGKGANQAVALAQLGVPVGLCGVVGDDDAGPLLEQARRDGVDVDLVVQRAGTRTALIVDMLPRDRRWRYLEDVPTHVMLTAADVTRAAHAITPAHAVLV